MCLSLGVYLFLSVRSILKLSSHQLACVLLELSLRLTEPLNCLLIALTCMPGTPTTRLLKLKVKWAVSVRTSAFNMIYEVGNFGILFSTQIKPLSIATDSRYGKHWIKTVLAITGSVLPGDIIKADSHPPRRVGGRGFPARIRAYSIGGGEQANWPTSIAYHNGDDTCGQRKSHAVRLSPVIRIW